MEILVFALKRKILSFFRNAESTFKLILNIVYIAFVVFYGAMIGFMIDLIEESDETKIDIKLVKNYILFAYGIMMVLFEFFPAYKNRSRVIPKIYAVSATKRWLVNIIYDFIKPTNLAFVGSLILIDVVSKVYTSLDLLKSLLFFFNTYLFLYLFKTFIEENHRLKSIKWLWLAFIVAFVLVLIKFDSLWVLAFFALGFLFQAFCSILLEKNIVGTSANRFSYNFITNSAVPAIYWAFIKNPKSRSGYFTQLTLKTAFTIFTTTNPMFKGIFFGEFVWLLYISPLVIFNYMANNVWGFFPTIWLNTAVNKSTSTFEKYLQILAIPILIDCILTLIILLFFHKLDLNLILFYFSTTILLLTNGLLFTYYKPLVIDSGVSFTEMKSKVSGWSILLSMTIVIVLSALKNFIWVLFPVLIIAIILFYYIQKEIRQKHHLRYTIFSVLRGE